MTTDVRYWRQHVCHTKQNDRSMDRAEKRKQLWTDSELERIMEDDLDYSAVARELGRTVYGVKMKRQEIKIDLEKELDDYDGPLIPLPKVLREDNADDYERQPPDVKKQQDEWYAKALRQVCIGLTSCSMRTTEQEVGSEDHHYELLTLYAMMGLMDDAD